MFKVLTFRCRRGLAGIQPNHGVDIKKRELYRRTLCTRRLTRRNRRKTSLQRLYEPIQCKEPRFLEEKLSETDNNGKIKLTYGWRKADRYVTWIMNSSLSICDVNNELKPIKMKRKMWQYVPRWASPLSQSSGGKENTLVHTETKTTTKQRIGFVLYSFS